MGKFKVAKKKEFKQTGWRFFQWPIVGVVDVGSNAIRASLAEVGPTGIEESETRRFSVRLGNDVFRNGRTISSATQANLIEAFSQIKNLFDKNKVQFYRAVATSALRSAKNKKAILNRILKSTQLNVELIDSHLEGCLVGHSLSEKYLQGWTLLLDLGGGSLEMALYHHGHLMRMTSLPLGAVRVLEAEKKLLNEQKRKQKNSRLKELTAFYSVYVANVYENDPFMRYFFHQNIKDLHVVGSGGNIRSLYRLSKKILKRKGSSNPSLKRDDLRLLIQRLEALSERQRQKKYGLAKDRADVIVPAGYVFYDILHYIDIDKIYVPQGVSLRKGILKEFQKSLIADV